jgi:hypothetical protein
VTTRRTIRKVRRQALAGEKAAAKKAETEAAPAPASV